MLETIAHNFKIFNSTFDNASLRSLMILSHNLIRRRIVVKILFPQKFILFDIRIADGEIIKYFKRQVRHAIRKYSL